LSGGPGGEIGEGALVDFGTDADRFTEEDGRGRVSVGDGLNVHGSMILLLQLLTQDIYELLHGYIPNPTKSQIYRVFKTLQGKWHQKEREVRTR
jgi:hypothetical protein